MQGLALAGPLQDQVDGRGQTRIMVRRLKHVIIQPGLHRLDRDFLAAGTGKHDYRAIPPAPLHSQQYLDAVGPAQLVVCHRRVQPARFDYFGQLTRVGRLFELGIGKFS